MCSRTVACETAATIKTSSTPRVPSAIAAALAQMPMPMVVVHLPTERYVRTNQAWDSLFGGLTFEQIVSEDDLDDVRKLLNAIVDHRIDGYQRRGRFHTVDGRQILANLSLQRLRMADTPDLAITVIVPGEQAGTELSPWISFAGELVDLAVLATDHDWRVEHASNDVEALLGCEPGSIIGEALLGMVHPDDALKFLEAISGTFTLKQAKVVRVRLRAPTSSWRDLVCFVTALCEHKPPRLAVLLTGAGSEPTPTEASRTEELEQHLWRIAMEVRAAGLVQDVGNTLPVDRTREFTELSGRQWEVVTRLVDGQRVPEIARSMYLSPSTVRNHLTVVFRKFGVHSQRELVALLTNAARSTS